MYKSVCSILVIVVSSICFAGAISHNPLTQKDQRNESQPRGEIGACCYDDGNSCEELPQIICEVLFLGTWLGEGSSCVDGDCSIGACCLTAFGDCLDQTTEQDCNAQGGDFLGALSTCNVEGDSCQESYGACCLWWSGGPWGKCYEMPNIECDWMGGEFYGEDTTCANDAPGCTIYYGACCYGDYCDDSVSEPDCEWSGGIFWYGLCEEFSDVPECVSDPDPIGGACCIDGTQCVDEVVDDIACWLEFGGVFYGEGSTCQSDASDCSESVCEADLNNDGYVGVEDLLAVIDAWGDFESPSDINSDGIVNVSDLLMVVGSWGPCE